MRLALLLILSFPLWAQFQNVPSTRYPGLEAILNAKPAAQVAAGVPSGNCTVGKDFYVNSTAHTLYYCSATNTWVQIAGATASTTVNGTTCTLGSTCTVTAAPSGSAGGDLAGTYPNPTLKNKGAANGPVMADGSGNVAIRTTVIGDTAYNAVTDASPIAWSAGGQSVTNGVVTLAHATATRALNVSNLLTGGFYTLIVKQDSTGGAAVTGGTGCTWLTPGGLGSGAFAIATTASAVNIISFTYDGTNCLVIPAAAYSAM